MNTRHGNADGPEDIDAAFAEIVAELERDDTPLPKWPVDSSRAEDSDPVDPARSASAGSEPAAEHPGGPRSWSPSEEEDEGHFEPPDPPPLPAPKAGTVGGVALIVLGFCLLVVPGLVGWIGTIALPLGLVSISVGIGWLLLRMRPTPPDSEWDDGAQL
ncbi:hypothetical protein DFQ14_105190 [Halopolyspora algeriensis]|uniref:DUF308 domain-containing protein n=1 Tax=Halopolyspora algeriensis TaxID=1500506 RepID=A0A368VSD9_9ACTN|nr:DUF308 domain-containing protein [Halopolyspora algeriensis]RCW44045.1 hypothetical protein DFQ14_105190 [Halopolyspora algeriensis]TQM53456.1 hypothetical protein FHU43_2856 [Halopolyspora algeriensis]